MLTKLFSPVEKESIGQKVTAGQIYFKFDEIFEKKKMSPPPLFRFLWQTIIELIDILVWMLKNFICS